MSNDYTTEAMLERIKLKAFTSNASSLTDQQLLNLANDSLRSYLVPLTQSLREEWWVGKTDLLLTSDADGSVTVPDSVASTLRTVGWNNNGFITPLTRVEPEASFQYQNQGGALPVGFMLRGYTLILLPKVAGIVLHLTAMLRPPKMVLVEDAAEVLSAVANVLTLDNVPVAWQEETPTEVDLINGASPFSRLATYAVSSLDVAAKQLTLVQTPTLANETWAADVDCSPFANVPCELFPLLEQDVIVQLFGTGLGDKRGKGAAERKKELEEFVKRTCSPRASGNARPIVNANAPGMRGFGGMGWGRRW